MTAAQQTDSGKGGVAHRVAFVTGGTRGIGAAISMALADQGASIAAGYHHNHEVAEKFAADMASEHPGSKFTVHDGNIGHADDCRRVVREVLDQHGRLDILVNNAGITRDKVSHKLTDDDWNHVLDINLSGAFFAAQAALGHMIERGNGRIINVSSIIGETGNVGQVNYAASKSGLFGLTKSLAREVIYLLGRAGHNPSEGVGLTVNCVTPGFIATDMVAAMPEKALDRVRAQIPVGRLGTPQEVARVVAFLAADESSFITGQMWAVNGGQDM
ncbi:MAG: 3-oxoacyl-ACP reductase FabG [Streptosporangiaceae bacterium]